MCKDTKIPRILQINLPFTLLFGVNKRYKNALPPVFSAISLTCAAFGMVSGRVRDGGEDGRKKKKQDEGRAATNLAVCKK